MTEVAARAQASALVETMPEFWRTRFEQIVKIHGKNRRARRMAAALIRRYLTWIRVTSRLQEAQAKSKVLRASRLVRREIAGMPRLVGCTQAHIDSAVAFVGT